MILCSVLDQLNLWEAWIFIHCNIYSLFSYWDDKYVQELCLWLWVFDQGLYVKVYLLGCCLWTELRKVLIGNMALFYCIDESVDGLMELLIIWDSEWTIFKYGLNGQKYVWVYSDIKNVVILFMNLISLCSVLCIWLPLWL